MFTIVLFSLFCHDGNGAVRDLREWSLARKGMEPGKKRERKLHPLRTNKKVEKRLDAEWGKLHVVEMNISIQTSLIMTSCQYVYLVITSRKTLAKYSDATVVLWLAGV